MTPRITKIIYKQRDHTVKLFCVDGRKLWGAFIRGDILHRLFRHRKDAAEYGRKVLNRYRELKRWAI